MGRVEHDALTGEVVEAPFHINPLRLACWKHARLALDVVPGQGGVFSLENGSGQRLHVRLRILGDAQAQALKAPDRFHASG
jgi:uncharacterized protein